MERVFVRCRKLTPRTALYVIMAAVLWLPVSIGLATAIHARSKQLGP
jgi:predicted ATPase